MANYEMSAGLTLSQICLASRTPRLSIFGVQWRQGIKIWASSPTDCFIPTSSSVQSMDDYYYV